jgi:hypothetical protein
MAVEPAKIFGKFELHEPHGLRDWEIYFGIEDREGVKAWKSNYTSVQNLLRHLTHYTKSTSTRSVYLRILHRFCKHTGKNPDQLVALPPKQVNGLIMDFVGELGGSGLLHGAIEQVNT